MKEFNHREPDYSGQCMGGPDHGNLITSSSNEWLCVVTIFRALDAGKATDVQVVKGSYAWDSKTKTWEWKLAKEKV